MTISSLNWAQNWGLGKKGGQFSLKIAISQEILKVNKVIHFLYTTSCTDFYNLKAVATFVHTKQQ